MSDWVEELKTKKNAKNAKKMTQFFKTGVGSARVDECTTNEIQNFKFATFIQLITFHFK